MQRRLLCCGRSPLFLALIGLMAILSGAPAPAGSPKPARPNVLFIAVDDLRPELGCYGSRAIKSPNIDRLAASGVTFTRAYCQQAVCNPSRASLLTGLRPDSLRVWDLTTHFRTTRPEVATLPQCFARQGYHTAAIGKIYHHNLPDPPSWSEPKLDVPGYPFYPGVVYRDPATVERLARRRGELLAEGYTEDYLYRLGHRHLKSGATECADVPDGAYFDGAQTDVAVAKLRELRDRGEPFFFGVGYHRPHLPFIAPKKYWDLYDRDTIPLAEHDKPTRDAPGMAINTMQELRDYEDFANAPRPDQGKLTEAQARLLRHGYFASVSYTDAQIGRLLDALEELGLADNTIVVLWGDHGWKLGEHQSWCKMTNYEIDTRSPLIVRAPGLGPGGRSCARLVEFVDVYPTLCELADLAPPEGLEGTSFVPLLANVERPWKSAAFSQFLRADKWIAPDGVPYMGDAIRTDRWRYVEWYRWDVEKQTRRELVARELYDEQNDPHETANLANLPEQASVVEALSKQLHAGWRAARPK